MGERSCTSPKTSLSIPLAADAGPPPPAPRIKPVPTPVFQPTAKQAPTRMKKQKARFKIETANTTSWKSAKRYLEKETDASLVLLQEIGAEAKDRRDHEASARKMKWNLCLHLSVVTEAGGSTSGIGVAALAHVGMGKIPGSRPLYVPSRVCLTWVNAFIPGGFIAGSIYLPQGAPTGSEGSQIWARDGEILHALGPPFVLAGDWNIEPQDFHAYGWAQKVGGVIIAPQQATCRSTAKKWRTLDFFRDITWTRPVCDPVQKERTGDVGRTLAC